MHQAFHQLGCTNEAVQAIVNEQGINNLIELRFLMDKDVKMSCHNIKQPGGVAAGDGGGVSLGHI